MLIVRNSCNDAAFNLALEEVLLKECDADVFMLWQNSRAVIVGNNQNTAQEIDKDFADKNGISVIRRLTGGGAVFHDLGNLNFTFIKRGKKDRFLDFEYFNRPIIGLLESYGFSAVNSVRNDILIDGKKVSGNAQTIHGDSVLHHGTLLFHADMSLLTKVLRPHPYKIESKAIPSVRSRVANLSDLYKSKIDIEKFKEKAQQLMAKDGARFLDAQTDTSLFERAEDLSLKKYSTWEWNYGYSPAYSMQKTAYTSGGLIEVHTQVKDGIICGIKFFGDFSGLLHIGGLEEKLIGVPHAQGKVNAALNGIDTALYISGADKQSIMNLIV